VNVLQVLDESRESVLIVERRGTESLIIEIQNPHRGATGSQMDASIPDKKIVFGITPGQEELRWGLGDELIHDIRLYSDDPTILVDCGADFCKDLSEVCVGNQDTDFVQDP